MIYFIEFGDNFIKYDMGENILKACKAKNIGTTLMKVNPVGSYHAYKARLEETEKQGKPNAWLQGIVERLKGRLKLTEDFIKKHKLTSNEAIRTAAYRFVLANKDDKASTEFPLEGVFISIGTLPRSDLAKGIGVKLDDHGHILVDQNMKTNIDRVYAAGDVIGGIRQIVTAVSEGAMAALSSLPDLGKQYPFY